MSKTIGDRLNDSKNTQKQIEESRDCYRPVAVRGSLLYFTIAELCKVDHMYQYGLHYFQVSRTKPRYVHRLPRTTPSNDLQDMSQIAMTQTVGVKTLTSQATEARHNINIFQYPRFLPPALIHEVHHRQ